MRVNLICWITIMSLLGNHVSHAQTYVESSRDFNTLYKGGAYANEDFPFPDETVSILNNPRNPKETFQLEHISIAADEALSMIIKMKERNTPGPTTEFYVSETPFILDSVPVQKTIEDTMEMLKEWNRHAMRVLGTVVKIALGTTVTYVGFALAPIAYNPLTISAEVSLAAVSAYIFGYYYPQLQKFASRRAPGESALSRFRNFSSEWIWKRFFLFSGIYNALFVAFPYALESHLAFNGWDYVAQVLKYSAWGVLVWGLIENAMEKIKREMVKEAPRTEDRLSDFQSAVSLFISAAVSATVVADALDFEVKDVLSGTLLASGLTLQFAARTSFIGQVKSAVRKLTGLRTPTCEKLFAMP